MWTKGRAASSELLRARLASLSGFSSDFSHIIQLFFHSVSLSSRTPSSGGRNSKNPIPHRRIVKNSCLNSTLWELSFRTELLRHGQTSAFFSQGRNVLRSRLLKNPTNQIILEHDAAPDLQSLYLYGCRGLFYSILWMNAHSYLNLHTDIQIYVYITDLIPPNWWFGALSKTLIYCALSSLMTFIPRWTSAVVETNMCFACMTHAATLS